VPAPDLYPLGTAVFRGAFHLLGLDVASVGDERIPTSGPAVLASNHVGYLDFAFVALAPPRPRRRVRFVARRDIFQHPVAGPLMRGLRQIEADPYGDPEATTRQAIEVLTDGGVVGIHPEGTISPSFVPRTGRTGAVRMAQATGAAIVPCAVWGSQRLVTKWRPRNLQRGVAVRVHYGDPYHPVGDPRTATDELMRRIGALVDEAAAAYPQEPADRDDRWWLPAHRGGTAPTPAEAERRLAQQHARRRSERHGEAG
jgi:1-acyl-sn-glycerol-3-phosphate acyltransferase